MQSVKLTLILTIFVLMVSCSRLMTPYSQKAGPGPGETWRALHVLNYASDSDMDTLAMEIPQLAKMGLNVLIFEIDYDLKFKSHPELIRSKNPITPKAAQKFVKLCNSHGIKVIPQFQCLAHQSWAKETFPLLTEYPELDLTPGVYANNDSIYCREWDPMNPKVNEIVFALLDEIIDAFYADAFHVGMDEVFLLTDKHATATKDKDPAEVYAKVVNEIHDHLVTKGCEMLMWADRFIDSEKITFGTWEASANGTHPAIDLVPKDIIMCDWHYETMDVYPSPMDGYLSVPMFLEKGFRVLPCSWRNLVSSKALIEYSLKQDDPKMLGHLFTMWSSRKGSVTEWPPMVQGLLLLTQGDNNK
ncbi:family 20 glycosylhydrolase [candidate division KSB1 bacterium]|nr:family 20 glycosylhydrolase [candidate division KSB1 bacterium]